MTGKVEDKNLEEYENENYHLLWWSDKRHFPYNCLGFSEEDNSVSRTDNFVNVNVFNSVTSPCVLSYRCVLHYFLTIPVKKLLKSKKVGVVKVVFPFLAFLCFFGWEKTLSYKCFW